MWSRLRQVIGVDERSLALLRVALGTILLVDLAIRATSLTAHYTDAGILPRAAHLRLLPDPWAWSLHMLSGSAFHQGVLFFIAAGAAAALVVGYRTRLMTIVSWLLLVSLHARNPMILNAGDAMLRMLLLWSIFLPLGRRASVDRMRRPVTAPAETNAGETNNGETRSDQTAPRDPWVVSVAGAALLLQVILVYLFSGLGKFNAIWWSGGAMETILSMDLYARPLGAALLDHPELLAAISRATPWFEVLVPLAALAPVATQRVRLAVIGVMLLFHLGIELTLHVGLFSFVAGAGWMAFLPPVFWDWCGRREAVRQGRQAVRQRLAPWLTRWTVRPAAADSAPRPGVAPAAWWASNVLAAALLVYVLVWPVRAQSTQRDSPDLMPLGLTPIGSILSVEQQWTMFTHPSDADGWFIIVGEFQDGTRLELLTGKPFDPYTIRKPQRVAGLFPDHRWRKYYRNLSMPRNAALRPYLPRVLCDQWSARDPDNPMHHLEITFIHEIEGDSDGPAELRQTTLYRGPCPRPTDIDFTRPDVGGGL